jgi:glycosyltransferase involved in cell wall biosynthesis
VAEPSGAADTVANLLARGLAEEGHEVHYLLPAGAEQPLPEGVRLAAEPTPAIDVFHNLAVDGRPWVVTVHGYRPPAGYLDRWSDGPVPDPRRLAEPPYDALPQGICVSRTLARSFSSDRHVLTGIDPGEYAFSATKDGYFLFMAGMQGRAYPDIYQRKGLDRALALSRALGFELVVAGTAREPDVLARVSALCQDAGARYVGDVRGTRKAELLAGARALLMPTRLEEGCPLVILEALMSGTPVVCSDRGGCPELVTPDVGFVCADDAQLAAGIERVGEISPQACREKALRDFHYRRMAADYAEEYLREIAANAR